MKLFNVQGRRGPTAAMQPMPHQMPQHPMHAAVQPGFALGAAPQYGHQAPIANAISLQQSVLDMLRALY
jgi:hypothetical protein